MSDLRVNNITDEPGTGAPNFINGLKLGGSAETANAATHYYVETVSDGIIRPKTLANVRTEIVTNTAVGAAGAVMNTGNETIAGIKTFSNTISGSINGNAVNLSTNNSNWSTAGTITAVVGQLAWKNYGNSHTIFDASASTSPSGSAVNNTNPAVGWSATYPTIMGWNGVSTYGVRVDSARTSDTLSGLTATVAEINAFAMPGAVVFFASGNPPAGFLRANGAAVSRTTYAALFAVLGTYYGGGNGSTTFNVPDLRGEFLRGLDEGRGVDSGRALGTAQGDAIRNMTGTFSTGANSGDFSGVFTSGGARNRIGGSPSLAGVIVNFAASSQVATAAENRPRNIALLACIKW
jgi:microcystin-dependent protein